MIGPVYHDPARLRSALLGTKRPVVFDCETTGLDVLRDRILSFGFRVHNGWEWENHILFSARCCDLSVQPFILDDAVIMETLNVLDRPGIILVGHNLKYDLLMARHEGYQYNGFVRDTLVMLRLLDQDRGFIRGDRSDKDASQRGRYDHTAPQDQSSWLNYQLKDVASHLLSIKALRTPRGSMLYLSYRKHAEYLGSDLYATQHLHDYLWAGMSPTLRWYWVDIQMPLMHLLCDMKEIGVRANRDFVRKANEERDELLRVISDEHQKRFGAELVGMTDDDLRHLLYRQHRIRVKRVSEGKPAIASDDIDRMIVDATDEQIKLSLRLVHAFRAVESLRDKLNEQADAKYVGSDGCFHANFDNIQVTGRISCEKPNLQQIARDKVVLKDTTLEPVTIGNRNLVVARDGHILMACDAAQADVRILAHEINRCQESTVQHRRRLIAERFARLPHAYALWQQAREFINPYWVGDRQPLPPNFQPGVPSKLMEIFEQDEDFYPLVAKTVMGKTTITKKQRQIWKVLTLSQINGKAAKGIADELNYTHGIKCSTPQAEVFMQRFYDTFPEIPRWRDLQLQQVALAGRTFAWSARMRTNTAHYWMVSERRVRLLLTFHSGEARWRYWFDVTPIKPAQRFLTCYVHRVWSNCDERGDQPTRLIYDDTRGRIGTRRYEHLDDVGFYHLPFRNIAWRSIRWVQKLDRHHDPVERAKYEGFDKTGRQLVNAVMQAGTADLVTTMMIRNQQVCRKYGAKLLINIHDELVYELPDDKVEGFVAESRAVCEESPQPDWNVPIKMEFKTGKSFGTLGMCRSGNSFGVELKV